jgi:hypothetical protein
MDYVGAFLFSLLVAAVWAAYFADRSDPPWR